MSTAFPQLDDNDLIAQGAREAGTTATTVDRGTRRVPWRFFAGRAAFYLFTLWAAITINFFLPRLMKGDAVTSYLARNRTVSPEAADALRILLGIDTDKSLWQQYLEYWGMLLRGDLGISTLHGLRPVAEVLGRRCPGHWGWWASRRSSRSRSAPSPAPSSAGSAGASSTRSSR